MSAADVRRAFLEFFRERGHTVVPRARSCPGNDPTLLFTNAGMVQFKDVFLGKEKRDYVRAASSQRCVRAGGKHNDLENVGYTARHHTFFEMLGNFSFGDYFKKDAIRFAWEFVTGKQRLRHRSRAAHGHGLPHRRRGVRHLAQGIGLPPERSCASATSRAAAPTTSGRWATPAPAARAPKSSTTTARDIPGGPPGSPDADGDRWIEIWNLVFMQFDRAADGKLTPLPKPSVDTGMGLERIAAVMQGVHSNYDIDLFKDLIEGRGRSCGHDRPHQQRRCA